MDPHIGENGSLIARIVHDDPDVIEAFVQELRVRTNTKQIDWFYIVNTIALIKAIGDLPHIRRNAKEVFPTHCSIPLHLVA
ncbi:MAG: hypothetical protein AAB445_04345 [Patescibacteria group bacterium]